MTPYHALEHEIAYRQEHLVAQATAVRLARRGWRGKVRLSMLLTGLML